MSGLEVQNAALADHVRFFIDEVARMEDEEEHSPGGMSVQKSLPFGHAAPSTRFILRKFARQFAAIMASQRPEVCQHTLGPGESCECRAAREARWTGKYDAEGHRLNWMQDPAPRPEGEGCGAACLGTCEHCKRTTYHDHWVGQEQGWRCSNPAHGGKP